VRTLVVTGPAGAGTSTVARGLAHRCSEDGQRTLLLREARPGDSMQDEEAEGPAARAVEPLQWGTRLWDSLAAVRGLVGPPWQQLDGSTVLAVPPLREVAWWGMLRSAWQEPWDAVVVDAGPVEEALRWLTLPDLTVGLLRRSWPLAERTGEAADRLQAGSWHLRAMARLDSEAAELADRLRSSATSIHLVAPPREHELGRTLHALAPMALFELPVTDLVVNRVQQRRRYDRAVIERLPGQLSGLTVRTAPESTRPPVPGPFGRQLYPELGRPSRTHRPRVGRTAEEFVWIWPLPFAEPSSVAAQTVGDNLILTVGEQRRVLPLPSVLRRCELRAATFEGSVLRLTFIPNPAVWPANREVP
jgi:arsenite-transporting ATPase